MKFRRVIQKCILVKVLGVVGDGTRREKEFELRDLRRECQLQGPHRGVRFKLQVNLRHRCNFNRLPMQMDADLPLGQGRAFGVGGTTCEHSRDSTRVRQAPLDRVSDRRGFEYLSGSPRRGPRMKIVSLESLRKFAPDKMSKNSLFETPRFFCDLYCLEPGQGQSLHAHSKEDKVMIVLEGEVLAKIGEDEESLEAGEAVLAGAGLPHALKNEGPERAVVLVFMAPHPAGDRVVNSPHPAGDRLTQGPSAAGDRLIVPPQPAED